MRPELNQLATIDNYLNGKLSEDQKTLFEKKLASDKDFRQKVEDQIALRKGVERIALKEEVTKARKKYGKGKGFGKGLIIGLTLLALASALWFTNSLDKSEGVETKPLTEETTNPEEYLDAQVFRLNLEETEVIETEYMLLSIPDDAFIDADGNVITDPVDFVVREAFDPLSIIKAGLETYSNGQLLESRGMFHLSATSNGNEVFVNPNSPIVADVEMDKPMKDLQIWDGENDGKGNINWVNPKKPENFLIPVDIIKLDFYPNGFIEALEKQGKDIGNKQLTDSIYYALVEQQLEEVEVDDTITEMEMEWNADYNYVPIDSAYSVEAVMMETVSDFHWIPPSSIEAIWNKQFQNTLLSTNEFQKRLKTLHEFGSKEMIEVYVNNLDKDMYYSDSIVNSMLSDNMYTEYVSENAGSVKGTELKAIKKLADYYKRMQIIRENAAIGARKAYEKKFNKMAKKYSKSKRIHDERAQIIKTLNYQKEYEHNLKEVCKQLGIKKLRGGTEPTTNTRFIVQGLGFKNLDRIVAESTSDRNSVTIKDSKTGKTAKIVYKKVKVTVENDSLYDKVVPYMIPSGLYSFQKMNKVGSHYSEKLNESLGLYQLVFIGFKGDQLFMAEQYQGAGFSGDSLSISMKLEATTQKDINDLFDFGERKTLRDIKKDLSFQRLEVQFKKEQKQFLDQEAEKREILKAISKHQGSFYASDYQYGIWEQEVEVTGN